jgi:CDGSH-type Zn-finger protein
MSTPSHPAAPELPAGAHALCTCGLSKNDQFCDGSHTKLNVALTAQHPWWKFWG